MSETEFHEFTDLVQLGLDKAFIKMLEEKAALNLHIATVDANGNPILLPAKEVMEKYLASRP